MRFKKLNVEKIIFIFLLSVSFVFSVNTQAKTKEEQAQDIIRKSKNINEYIEFYKNKGVEVEPKIVVDGLTAFVNFRSNSVTKSDGFSITAKIKSKYRKYPSYLDRYREFGTFIVLNKVGEVEYIYFEPKSEDEIYLLKNFKKLIGVSLRDSNINKLDFTGISGVKELSIIGSDINTIVLPKVNNIEVIYLTRTPIENIENMNFLDNLDVLKINSSKLSSISSLINSSKLRKLYFNSNRKDNIVEFPDLSVFPNLEYLHFFSREVKNIRGISNLENLKVLFTGQSFNYSGVKFPKSLEYLSTGGTVNSSFPDLDNNTNLKELSIVDTNSSDMSLLNLPSNLEKLTLAYNNINKIEGIDGLEKLKEVNLSGNNIEKVEGLDGLESIEYLKLDKNKIMKVEGLKSLSGVKGISFENNPIETLDFSEIEHLKNTKVLMWYTPFWKTATKEDKRKLDNLARKGHL